MLNFQVNRLPSAARMPELARDSGMAEEGVAHAHIVHEERRQQKDHHQQNGILEVRQGLQLPCGELLRGNSMQQILKPPEGTQKSADKPSQKNSQQDEEAGDIIGKAEL